MTLKFLLDTTTISAPLAKDPDRRIVSNLDRQSFYCAIAAPVWHELVYGCCRLPAGKRRNRLQEYLDDVVRRSFPILPYDEAAADWHGRQRAGLAETGRTPAFVDGQIASIACTRGLTLVTANLKDFDVFADLEIVNWAR